MLLEGLDIAIARTQDQVVRKMPIESLGSIGEARTKSMIGLGAFPRPLSKKPDRLFKNAFIIHVRNRVFYLLPLDHVLSKNRNQKTDS